MARTALLTLLLGSVCVRALLPQASNRPRVLLRLAGVGALAGPAVDAVHNQALLNYDVLPVAVPLGLGVAKTSLLIPPLLALAYAVLGGLLPPLAMALVGGDPPSTVAISPGRNAALAVSSTVGIIKLSELLQLAQLPTPAALLLLTVPCALQWRLLDGSRTSLALALLAAVGGPLAEIPLMKLGLWHYTAPDYWPLQGLSFGPGTGNDWAGLSAITGPCYFAVTTDAIALGRWFGREPSAKR